MRSKRLKQLSFILAIFMVVSLVVPKIDFAGKTAIVDNKTKLKTFTVSDEELEEIVAVAKNDGSKAADMVNKFKGNDFEAAVNKVLTEYYKKGKTDCLKEFEKKVDSKADNIIKGYEEAAEERANEEKLPYEAGVSLVSFGADITEEEIKNIVKDQYGECEYIHKSPDGTYMVKVKNSLGLTVDKAVEAYGEYTQTIHTASNDKVEQAVEAYELVNDAFVREQYYLSNMQVADAWQFIRGRNHSRVRVVVIDGGADLNCVDLRNSSSLSAEILSNGSIIPLSQSSQQYINDHGTYVAGVIAATANNGSQIAGVASCVDNDVVELINVKIDMYVDKIAMGIDYATQQGAKVVNISLGSARGQNDMERSAIDRFVATGGTVVCGAGNDGNDAEYYPSDYDNAIGVISVDSGYNIAGSSNRGWRKEICAPGVGIYAPGAGDTTFITNGTSLACPMVTGVVAMMYSVNQGLNSNQVRDIIRNTARDIGEPGRDYTYAYGFINAYNAVVTAAGDSTGGNQPVDPTTPADGLTECVRNNNTLVDYWGYYVGDWAGATARYSGGTAWDNFVLKVTANNGDKWGVQAFTAPVAVNPGSKYNVSVTINSDRGAGDVEFKEDISDTTLQIKGLAAGDNTFSGTFTASGDRAQFFLDLGAVQAETTIRTVSISLTEDKPVETTTPQTVITNWETVENSNGAYQYKNATNVDVVNIQQPGFATANGIYMSTSEGIGYVTINDTRVGDESVAIQGAGVLVYLTALSTESSKISLYNGNGGFLGSVELKNTPEEVTTTPPATEPPTTTANTTGGGIEINGYQISATAKGMRTVYSVDSTINGKSVKSSGIIYSLSDYVNDNELYVGSPSDYVRSYESTSAGKLDNSYSESGIDTSYVMTMKFATKEPSEYNAAWKIRAYAQLSDNTYVYTDVHTYTIYSVADVLYQNSLMETKDRHDYLYSDILSIVDKSYAVKDYNWNNSIAGAQ